MWRRGHVANGQGVKEECRRIFISLQGACCWASLNVVFIRLWLLNVNSRECYNHLNYSIFLEFNFLSLSLSLTHTHTHSLSLFLSPYLLSLSKQFTFHFFLCLSFFLSFLLIYLFSQRLALTLFLALSSISLCSISYARGAVIMV